MNGALTLEKIEEAIDSFGGTCSRIRVNARQFNTLFVSDDARENWLNEHNLVTEKWFEPNILLAYGWTAENDFPEESPILE